MTTTATPAIDAHALMALLDSGAVVELIDVRSPAEFESAHIPGAINVPLDLLSAHAGRIRDQLGGQVVLICQAGPRAVQAAQRLNAVGVSEARILEGGMGRWDDGSRTVRRGQQRWSLERQVRFVAGGLVLLGVGASVVAPWTRFLAGAVGAGLAFSAVSNTCAMGNLLTRLPCNRGSSCDIESNLAKLGSGRA